MNARRGHKGRKFFQNSFFWHTGYMGGIKEETFEETLVGKHPERLIERSVRRMLPKTKLGRHMEGRLNVYAGADHPHVAQQPVALNLAKALKGNK
jgi:large subunit ribosomal protein L13